MPAKASAGQRSRSNCPCARHHADSMANHPLRPIARTGLPQQHRLPESERARAQGRGVAVSVRLCQDIRCNSTFETIPRAREGRPYMVVLKGCTASGIGVKSKRRIAQRCCELGFRGVAFRFAPENGAPKATTALPPMRDRRYFLNPDGLNFLKPITL